MSELIDREAAIRTVNTAMFPSINAAKKVENILRTVPTAPRWVRCEERLPDVAEKVVAFAEGQIITAWRTFFSEPIGKWDTNDAVSVDNITHWMPLPEPPKEDA